MGAQKFLRVLTTLFSALMTFSTLVSVNAQPNNGFSSGNLVDKIDHSSNTLLPDERPALYLGRPSFVNCATMDSQLLETQRERKSATMKFPYSQLDKPAFFDYRYIPSGLPRNKKSQKAILLDVGDYVIKGNGSPVVDSGYSRGTGGSMGGILRSSGK